MAVWWKGEKVAYSAGQDTLQNITVDLPLEVGSHRLHVVVKDEDGNKTRRTQYVRGVSTKDEPGSADAQ